jgi:hypothetical protein
MGGTTTHLIESLDKSLLAEFTEDTDVGPCALGSLRSSCGV